MPLTDLISWYVDEGGVLRRWMRGGGTVTSTVPSPPTSVRASVAGTVGTVTWAVPVSNGGSPITGYVVKRLGTGGTTQNLGPTVFTADFTELTAGTTYQFSVQAVNDVGQSVAANATVTVSAATIARFPGDTRPLLTGQIIWGLDEIDKDPSSIAAASGTQPSGEFFAPEAGTGAVFGCMRYYYTSWANYDTNGSARTQATSCHNAGRICWTSMNPGTWSQQMTTANAGIMDRFIAWCEETAKAPIWFTIEHEPDASTKVPDQGSYAEWLTLMRWFRARMDAYANANGGTANYKWKNLAFAPIFTAMGFANLEVNSFIPVGTEKRLFDFIGVDPYTLSLTMPGYTPNMAKAVEWAKGRGWPIAVGEWAVMNSDPQAAVKIQDMYDKCTNGVNDVVCVNYFNSGVDNPDWPIKNTAATGFMGNKFVALAKNPKTVHYWDLTGPAGNRYARPAGV